MNRLKKVTAAVLLAIVMSMGGAIALGGPAESPGFHGAVEAPGVRAETDLQTTDFINATIIFMTTLVM